ncbi:response regulator [Chryseolinea sp. H1M3-3]|uniref:response regulator n=1 Tax=Chryseolinea sp. H1M3-3 TaxID=3034144 RepID=UPI0023ECA1D2|nr:response regulator [Chryseolinea sp. H1M3-3]
MDKDFKRNLVLGFSASLLILIVTSVASFVSIRNLLESAGLVNNTNQVIVEMNAIHVALLNAETGQRGYLLTGEEEFLAPYHSARERAFNAHARVKSLTADNQLQQDDLAKLSKLIEDRFHYLDISINAKKKGEPILAANLQTGQNIMTSVRETVRIMEEREKEYLITRSETMNRFASFTPPLIIAAAMIALFITVLFYARVRKDFEERLELQKALEDKDKEISNRISIIRSIADKIAQGNYNIRIDDRQSDALGSVALSLNKMAESLHYSFGLLSDKDWLQTGLARLNDTMIGEKEIEVLSREIIETIATYTNSNAGAFYLLEGGELHAVAGFSYLPGPARKVIKPGEGLLGQSVITRKLVELKNLPADNITVSFALGEVKPNHVVAIPVMDGYTIKGAVELASVASFTQREVEFLTAATPNVGIAISTAQNRRKLQELLEETQAQSEELRTQHTELENLNGELEIQSEKLQASEEELKVQQEELKQANQELEERSRLLEEKNQVISESVAEIQSKADQLAQSTKYKSEFLANMSHELRTPLNSILLLSRLMSENQEKNLSAEQVEYMKVIQSSGNGLLSLIDEILDLSKIEAGKMKLEYQSVSIADIVRDMQALFKPLADEKRIEFRTTIETGVPETIDTDKLRLEQILRNLISNAIKFTSKGYVSMTIEPHQKNNALLKFIVKDTGIGIPKEKHALVFEAFQQADGSTRRKFGGTGLGLSISRELVKLLGGSITLRSDVGDGSEFTVAIPLAPTSVAHESSNVLTDTHNEQPTRSPIIEKKYISTHIPENIPDDRDQIEKNDKVILIIEDDVNFAKSLIEYTHKQGYKAIVSVRGDEGIMLAQQFLPLGILLDIQLPVKSGWEVMEELKQNQETRHIPVHIMSSHEVKKESLVKGAVDFISKPMAFDQMSEIFKKIEYVLTHHPKKVLIVEENAKHAKALAYFLESFDVNLDIKSRVDDAIESLKGNKSDCVILDMEIPDQHSYTILEAVKKTPGLENLPIIIFTGKSLSQTEELKIKQYADSIVVKTAQSYKRILDEVSLFLHLMEKVEKDSALKYQKLGALDEVLKNKTILIADDDMRNIFSLTKALEKFKMNVIAAVDGKDAIEKLKANPNVDIVLMDMMMPEMDGYESTMAIRKDPAYHNLPIIAVTAKAMMGDRAKCINAGASDYITKPVDLDQLFSLLRVWLYEKGRKERA